MLMYFAHVCGGREVSSISSYSSMLVNLGFVIFIGSVSLLKSKKWTKYSKYFIFLSILFTICLRKIILEILKF